MSHLARAVNYVTYTVDELVNNHTLDLLGLYVTTEKHARERTHNAFLIGMEIGARDGMPDPRPEPRRREHLQLVR